MNPLSMVSNISGLPTPVKAGLGVAGGGSILGAVFYLLGDSPNRNVAVLIVAVGMILVLGLYMLFKWIVKMMAKRKANPLSQGLAGNAAAAPQGISEPARRARLDDLRRNFEQGCEKFRAAGKNLYSVPWYVLVGEPGSGKTEAIRHCNVGFPPGLQDQLQGAGGTLNMNWWFTNSAIILDTAGRLMFEEVAPGSTNEWAEFLKLLKQNRPNCPINGMLLVIPVDTLIKDSADQIEKKAGKIAQQFDQIQRTLGVRFPVFVIISKCDLLNGFREFFDDLNDPQLQHQIMGWSNPAALDERFDPALVTNHLETVKTRLFERRQNLLLDPVHTEDPQARRVDQVDALYSLPDSLVKIGPRLRRYLEMIFVAGEWSPKPLFLRGIYFTSSMTEGAALDDELAAALGVPVDSLPGGAIFRKDRAYFLRDLFLEKVFREKGLVTRASNADKQQQMRRLVVMGFGFIAVVTLGLVTYLSSRALEKSVGAQRNWWDTASKLNLDDLQIIDPKKGSYFNDPAISVGSKSVSLAQLFGDNLQQVKEPIHIPLVFKPMTFVAANVNEDRRVAYRALYERTVLRPAYNSVRSSIVSPDGFDPIKGTPALLQLMKLEYAKAVGKLPAVDAPRVELEPMFAFIYGSPDNAENFKKFQGDKETLQKVADWIYTSEAKGEDAWVKSDLAGTDASREAIRQGVKVAAAYWKTQTGDDSKALKDVNDVKNALVALQAAENDLSGATKNGTYNTIDDYRTFRDNVWSLKLKTIRDSAKAASDAWANATGGKSDVESLQKLYEAQKNRVMADANKAIDAMLALTPPAENAKDNESYKTLLAARAELEAAKKDIANSTPKDTSDKLAALDTAYLGRMIKGPDKADHRRFEVHQLFYEQADKTVVRDDANNVVTSLSAANTQVDKDYGEAAGAITQTLIGQGGDALLQAKDTANYVIALSGRAKKYLLADTALSQMPDTADKWEKMVQAAAGKAGPVDSLRRPAVPIATFVKSDRYADDDKLFSAMYAPDIAGDAFEKLDYLSKLPNDAGSRMLDVPTIRERTDKASVGFNAYKLKYIDYWRNTAVTEITFDYADFKTLHDKIGRATETSITEQLKAYGDRMANALDRVGATQESNAIKLAQGVSPGECNKVLTNWSNFPGNAVQVRSAILGMIANDFSKNYTVRSAQENKSFIGHYWNDLPVAALKALVADGQKQIQDGITELARYERFPLAPPGDKKDDLTLDDILAARAALQKIRGAATPTSGGPPAAGVASGGKSISQGGLTSEDPGNPVDDQLNLLRGTNLLRDKQEYFDKLDAFLGALPIDKKPLAVSFTVDKKKLASSGENSISQRQSYMPVLQAGKAVRANPVSLIGTTGADECTLEYPGGDITLQFQATNGGAVTQKEDFVGNWAIFRLIKNAKSATREGNKWTLEYNIIDAENKKPYAIWFNLEFKTPVPLPDLKDWPVPPGKGGSGN